MSVSSLCFKESERSWHALLSVISTKSSRINFNFGMSSETEKIVEIILISNLHRLFLKVSTSAEVVETKFSEFEKFLKISRDQGSGSIWVFFRVCLLKREFPDVENCEIMPMGIACSTSSITHFYEHALNRWQKCTKYGNSLICLGMSNTVPFKREMSSVRRIILIIFKSWNKFFYPLFNRNIR